MAVQRFIMKLYLLMNLCAVSFMVMQLNLELENHARQYSGSIRDDGLRKVLSGKTTS